MFSPQNGIDLNLYSRQLGAIGLEAQGKLIKMRVFIHGLRGLGIETAKNLILAGPHTVVLHDDTIVQQRDLCSNFSINPNLTSESIGKKTRSEASLPFLKDLNPYVSVETVTGDVFRTDFLRNFDVLVFTDYYDIEKLCEINEFARAQSPPIGFILAGSLGLYGFTFVDFGEKFKVFDGNGEDPRSIIVTNVTKEEQGVVTVHEDKKHLFSTGDHVTFSEIKGMHELNGKTFAIKVLSPYCFSIGDTRSFSDYEKDGMVTQVKAIEEKKFDKLADSLNFPLSGGKTLVTADFTKSPEQLHLILFGLFEFFSKNRALPGINDENHAKELGFLVKSLIEKQKTSMDCEGMLKIQEVDEQLVRNVSFFANTQISPCAAFWGGVVAQEIVKYTGKFTPLQQWFHYDVFESLPEKNVDRTPLLCRYDDMISIYGRETLEKLQKLRVFMVGAGALGCEFAKMLGLMGVSTKSPGLFTVTDDDNIEISNLNRQFLFRKADVGHSKAEKAVSAASSMNSELRVRAQKLRVCSETTDIFNDDFWESQDLVINAVDNVNARLFIDSQCVFYEKTLLESGTLGTKCNSQVILPHCTQSYGETSDPPEEKFAVCTLKNFPYQIEHTIQWARDFFEGNFVENCNECKKFLRNPAEYTKKIEKELAKQPGILLRRLENIEKICKLFMEGTFEACVRMARVLFEENFNRMIAQLIHTFGPDALTENGQPFWGGVKRFPQVITFEPEDPLSITFVASAANILANAVGLDYCRDLQKIKEICQNVEIPKFQLKKLKVDEKNPENTEEIAYDIEEEEKKTAVLLEKFRKFSHKSAREMRETEFEKDDDSNFHIDLIASVANLRARNYKIKELDRLKIKLIAGKIIPALATTTAMVVGAVGIELMKFVLGKSVENFKNSFMNLALPLWLFTEPLPPKKNFDQENDPEIEAPVKAIPPGFTVWDKIKVNGPATLQEFFESMKKNFNVSVSLASCGRLSIYNKYCQSPVMKERLNKDIKDIVEELSGKPIKSKYLALEVTGETENGVFTIMPTIKYLI